MPRIVWVIVVAMIALLIVVVTLDVRENRKVPTVCSALPATSRGPVAADALVIRDDEWRQLEFVASADRPAIEKQLAELHAFKGKHRKSGGWDDVYVRGDRKAALAPMGLSSSIVGELARNRRALALESRGRRQLVRDGFAADLGHGVAIYGQEADGKLLSLGLLQTSQQADFAAIEPALQSLCARAGLDLVDWPGERIYRCTKLHGTAWKPLKTMFVPTPIG